MLQLGIQYLLAAIIYKIIIPNRGTVGSYLLGWSFIIPISIYVPFIIISTLDIQNKIIKLGCANIMPIVTFRCIEAMYNTSSNPIVEVSLTNYVLYYTQCIPYVWDKTTNVIRTITLNEIQANVKTTIRHFILLSLLLSYLMHYDNFKPFPKDNVELNQYHVYPSITTKIVDLIHPYHLCNTYLHAVLTYCVLKVGFDVISLGENIKGYTTVPLFHNPLLQSQTPTEFWTKRWNLMIHYTMKVCAYMCMYILLLKVPVWADT